MPDPDTTDPKERVRKGEDRCVMIALWQYGEMQSGFDLDEEQVVELRRIPWVNKMIDGLLHG
jgi:hypothetical protein